jgi:hypothetical protein
VRKRERGEKVGKKRERLREKENIVGEMKERERSKGKRARAREMGK